MIKKLSVSKYPLRKNIDISEYQKWMDGLIVKRYNKFGSTKFDSFRQYAKYCIFKLDITFDQRRIARKRVNFSVSQNSYEIEHDNFLFIYNRIAEALYGRRFSRPHNVAKSPYVISCIDFEGSRYASSATLQARNAHIHSVWAVRPEDVGDFLAITSKVSFRLRFADQLDIDCGLRFERYRPSLSSVAGLVSYATKSLPKSTAIGWGAELLRIYPDANFSPDGKTYKASRKYPLWSRGLERRRRQMADTLASLKKEREPWEYPSPKFRTDDLDEFLDGETLLRADLESANDMLATLDGTNSGPYQMGVGEGTEPTIVKGATGNRFIIRDNAALVALKEAVEQMKASLTGTGVSS